jgi:DNA-binding winged helix-turn-helix (wHTH) protein/Tol biopolymer transport system component
LRLKLSGQPFQVLALLLERPGDVVTREEIQKRLWPADTFVDFDHSLNTAINKIREALVDSADNPRFVETLPRRGYRFIASVEVGAGSPWRLPALSSAHTVQAPAGHPQGVSPERPGGVSREPPLRTRWGLRLGAMLAMLVLGAAVAWYVWEHSRPRAELVQRQLTTNSFELAVSASAISPDGRYLAYADDSGIHLKVVDAGETHSLPTPAGSRINNLAWVPEGNKLLASVEAGEPSAFSLWTVSILGGTPQKLRDDAADGSAFEDGTGIVFVSGERTEIWRMNTSGEDARKLITASEGEFFKSPAVGEGRLWYVRGYASPESVANGLAYNLESRDLKGGPPSMLVSELAELPGTFKGPLRPHGRLIYSRMDRPDLLQGGSLWEIKADLRTGLPESAPRRITNWPDLMVSGLSATADGKRLAFIKLQTLASVYVGDLEGNVLRVVNLHRLTLSDSFDHAYAWTPDSRSVLFDSNRDGTEDVFTQALGQRTAEKLVDNPEGSMRPAMSPDGGSVLYLTPPRQPGFHRLHEPLKIMRVAFSGGPPQLLGHIQNWGEIRCARTANVCVVSDSGRKQRVLYALDPAKGKGRELLRTGPALFPGQDMDWDVSPDGSSLAFVKYDVQKEALEIQVRPLAGGAARELNITGWANAGYIRYMGFWESVGFIHWEVNGKGWYVTAPSKSGSSLLKVDPTGKAQRLTQGSSLSDCIPSPDGRHVVVMGQAITSNVWMLENF